MSKDNTKIERDLLQFLCAGSGEPQAREEVISHLRRYAFQSVEHQVLFDCLQEMPPGRPHLIRELLPARLVRAGFPDIDLAPFLELGEARVVSEGDAERLCRQLLAGVT